MNVKFSTQNFPVNTDVKDGSGSIWGCVIQPFKNNCGYQERSKNIDRCKKCFAYINNLVKFERGGWCCNICNQLNKINYTGYDNDDEDYSIQQQQQQQIEIKKSRYAIQQKDQLPELINNSIELLVEEETEVDELPDSIPYSMIPLMKNPIYIAIVDYSGSKEQHDSITQGLEALVHALPNNALFGLITYSTRIGLYNLNTSTPLIKFVENISDFNFSDILSIEKFLVNKGKNESNIIKAIQSIPLINETISKKLKSVALGDTIKLLIDYLSIDLFKLNVKIGLFISSSPVENEFSSLEDLTNNYGKPEFFKPTTNIYKKLAEGAIEIGAHFDIFAISDGDKHFGLDSLKFLCTLTGGQLYRYNKLLPTCTLPQDIYKLISYGWGFHGLIRIRTSRQFSIDNSYGSVIPSRQYDNLYHIESCSPFTSVAFDFKFNNSSGFQDKDQSPNIQIVFSYSYLPPIGAANEQQQQNQSSPTLLSSNGLLKNSGSLSTIGDPNSRIIQKRLHIFNISLPVADTPAQLFNSIDLETTISLLTHKIIRDSIERGIAEARIALVDWLKNIITKYNENVVILSSVASNVDVNFQQVSHLRPLPRYIFALLKSPILRELTTDIEASTIIKKSDDWVYHQCLYSNLEPRLLHRSIYPVLYSYGAPNNLASKYLPLSMNTILTSTSNIYLIDSFDHLIVFYNENEKASIHTFPPPPESLIRQTIANSKQDRLIVPEVLYLKGKLIDTPEFTRYLIDEENNAGTSFYNFLRDIQSNVKGRF